MTEKIRLQRYLSSAGVAARRKAEELIVAGHVRVNGKQVRLLGTKVDPVRDHVTVNGEAIHPLDKFYVLFNKPKGCVTAVEDERGRATVMEYLPNLPVPVRPVGRLDYYAEGVVLLTNDGELAARLTSSQRAVPKTYHVKVQGEVSLKHVEALRAGVRLEDGSTTQPAEVNFLPGESRHSWLGITVVENKQHQVQRMLEALGYQVQKLQCVAFATLNFHGLRVGDGRELTQAELNAIRDLVDLDHSVTTRGIWRTYREDTDIPRRAREKLRAEAAEAEAEAGEPISDWRDADADLRDERPARRGPARPEVRGDARGDRKRGPNREDRAPRAGARDERKRPGSRDGRGPARDDRAARAGARDERGPRAGRPAGRSDGRSSGTRDERGARPSARGSVGVRAGTSFGAREERGGRPARGPGGPSLRPGTSFGARSEREDRAARPSSRRDARTFGRPAREGRPDERPDRGRPAAAPSASRSATSTRPARGGQGAERPRFGQSEGRPARAGQRSARPAIGSARPRPGQTAPSTRPASAKGERAPRPSARPTRRK